MPIRQSHHNTKELIIQNALMKKLTIDLGDNPIDKNIIKAAKKLTMPRSDLSRLTELSENSHNILKTTRIC